MDNDMKRYLKVGGILCAIGAVSALLITTVNVFTAPKIAANEAEKKAAGFRSVYDKTNAVGEDTKVTGRFVSLYNVCYSDAEMKTAIGNVYTATGSYKHVSNMKVLIGVSGSQSSPELGKIYLLNNGATGGYDVTVKTNYVDVYNANPSVEAMNKVTCGATEAATIIRMMMVEAKELYMTGGISEDVASEIKSIYSSEVSYDEPSDVTGGTYASKYYPVYGENKTYIGTVYRLSGLINDGTGSKITLLIGMTGSYKAPTYGKIFLVKNEGTTTLSSYVDAYNAAPSLAALDANIPSDASASCALVKAMAGEAAGLFSAGYGNKTADGPYLNVYHTMKEMGEAVDVTGKTYVKKYNIAYGDAEKTNELGYIYECTGKTDPFTPYEGSEIHISTITLLVGVSGSASAPVTTPRVIISDDSWDGSGVTATGSTYSNTLIQKMVTEATGTYVSMKGGN